MEAYQVVMRADYRNLITEVNRLLKCGWVALGGVAVVFNPNDRRVEFYQSIFRPEK